MKKRKKLNRVLLVLLLVFVGIQFIRIDKSHPKIKKRQDFVAITNPPKDIEKLIRDACYDCHSYETKYPWYAEVAPFSGLLGVISKREESILTSQLGESTKESNRTINFTNARKNFMNLKCLWYHIWPGIKRPEFPMMIEKNWPSGLWVKWNRKTQPINWENKKALSFR